MARTPSPPRSPRAPYKHPDRARMIESSLSNESYQTQASRYQTPKQISKMTGTNMTPLIPRTGRSTQSSDIHVGPSSQMDLSPENLLKRLHPGPDYGAASSIIDIPQAAKSQARKHTSGKADRKKKKVREYYDGPPDPPADVVAWTGVSARNRKYNPKFFTGAYAIVWQKGNYSPIVETFSGHGMSNVYAEFLAVAAVLQICDPREVVLIKTTSSEVINAVEYGADTDFWNEVVQVRKLVRDLVTNRPAIVEFKKVPSRVGLPQNNRACGLADNARRKLEYHQVTQRLNATKQEAQSVQLPQSATVPMQVNVPRMPVPGEKAQEFYQDFQAFLRAKALASFTSSTEVDEDGHRMKARKLSHPSQRDPRVSGGKVIQQEGLPQSPPGEMVQNVIRPKQTSAAFAVEGSNDPIVPQQDESDDEFFDALDYWVEPDVKQVMDQANEESKKTKPDSTLSWILNLFDD